MAQDTFFSSKKTLNIRGNAVSLQQPKVMGIVNVTPDSFYEGSRIQSEKDILQKVEKMIHDGASFIDIGGYSSRPGAVDISVEEEMERVAPAIELIRSTFDNIYISCDTFRAKVAQSAMEAGADIINDISGGALDKNMFEAVAKAQVPYILMHMKGTPQTMTSQSHYDDIMLELIEYFQQKVYRLNQLGVKDVILDPGFGFAKTIEQNFKLLKDLKQLEMLELPFLAGLSRKSMIYKSLNISADEALTGTAALNMIALQNGASILRVHDVKEAVEIVKLFNFTYIN